MFQSIVISCYCTLLFGSASVLCSDPASNQKLDKCAESSEIVVVPEGGAIKKPLKQIYAELKQNVKFIREKCGEVCDTTKIGVPGG